MCYPLSPSNGPFSLFSQAARTSFTTESGNLGTAQAEATRYGRGAKSRTRESGSRETFTGGVKRGTEPSNAWEAYERLFFVGFAYVSLIFDTSKCLHVDIDIGMS